MWYYICFNLYSCSLWLFLLIGSIVCVYWVPASTVYIEASATFQAFISEFGIFKLICVGLSIIYCSINGGVNPCFSHIRTERQWDQENKWLHHLHLINYWISWLLALRLCTVKGRGMGGLKCLIYRQPAQI